MAGGIVVEGGDEAPVGGDAGELVGLLAGEGGAAGGEGGVVAVAGLLDCDGVEGAFDEDGDGAVGEGVGLFVHSEQDLALAVEVAGG